MQSFFSNDLQNPKYLFHGSPYLLDEIEPKRAIDANHNSENEDKAVFLTSSFVLASAYAFKDSIKALSEGLDWNFEIGYDADNDEINILFENVNLDDELEGYIYVFPYNENYKHEGKSIQYKSYDSIKSPVIIKVKFSDFKKYYSINNTKSR